MKEESDVGDGEPGDGADFPVAQAAVKLEAHDLALVVGQRVEDVEDLSERLALVVPLVQIACHRRDRIRVQRCASCRLLARVEREIPADGEEPRREMRAQPRRVFAAEPEKRLLHDITGRLEVAEQPFGVAGERPLVEVERGSHPVRFRRHASLPWITAVLAIS